ncbi:unnamed protein product [Amoebophrya sp. A25]|nr:unnamed protein product [Amoebophrya sp. A25]|eukprot:GSA25T00016145001.1
MPTDAHARAPRQREASGNTVESRIRALRGDGKKDANSDRLQQAAAEFITSLGNLNSSYEFYSPGKTRTPPGNKRVHGSSSFEDAHLLEENFDGNLVSPSPPRQEAQALSPHLHGVAASEVDELRFSISTAGSLAPADLSGKLSTIAATSSESRQQPATIVACTGVSNETYFDAPTAEGAPTEHVPEHNYEFLSNMRMTGCACSEAEDLMLNQSYLSDDANGGSSSSSTSSVTSAVSSVSNIKQGLPASSSSSSSSSSKPYARTMAERAKRPQETAATALDRALMRGLAALGKNSPEDGIYPLQEKQDDLGVSTVGGPSETISSMIAEEKEANTHLPGEVDGHGAGASIVAPPIKAASPAATTPGSVHIPTLPIPFVKKASDFVHDKYCLPDDDDLSCSPDIPPADAPPAHSGSVVNTPPAPPPDTPPLSTELRGDAGADTSSVCLQPDMSTSSGDEGQEVLTTSVTERAVEAQSVKANVVASSASSKSCFTKPVVESGVIFPEQIPVGQGAVKLPLRGAPSESCVSTQEEDDSSGTEDHTYPSAGSPSDPLTGGAASSSFSGVFPPSGGTSAAAFGNTGLPVSLANNPNFLLPPGNQHGEFFIGTPDAANASLASSAAENSFCNQEFLNQVHAAAGVWTKTQEVEAVGFTAMGNTSKNGNQFCTSFDQPESHRSDLDDVMYESVRIPSDAVELISSIDSSWMTANNKKSAGQLTRQGPSGLLAGAAGEANHQSSDEMRFSTASMSVLHHLVHGTAPAGGSSRISSDRSVLSAGTSSHGGLRSLMGGITQLVDEEVNGNPLFRLDSDRDGSLEGDIGLNRESTPPLSASEANANAQQPATFIDDESPRQIFRKSHSQGSRHLNNHEAEAAASSGTSGKFAHESNTAGANSMPSDTMDAAAIDDLRVSVSRENLNGVLHYNAASTEQSRQIGFSSNVEVPSRGASLMSDLYTASSSSSSRAASMAGASLHLSNSALSASINRSQLQQSYVASGGAIVDAEGGASAAVESAAPTAPVMRGGYSTVAMEQPKTMSGRGPGPPRNDVGSVDGASTIQNNSPDLDNSDLAGVLEMSAQFELSNSASAARERQDSKIKNPKQLDPASRSGGGVDLQEAIAMHARQLESMDITPPHGTGRVFSSVSSKSHHTQAPGTNPGDAAHLDARSRITDEDDTNQGRNNLGAGARQHLSFSAERHGVRGRNPTSASNGVVLGKNHDTGSNLLGRGVEQEYHDNNRQREATSSSSSLSVRQASHDRAPSDLLSLSVSGTRDPLMMSGYHSSLGSLLPGAVQRKAEPGSTASGRIGASGGKISCSISDITSVGTRTPADRGSMQLQASGSAGQGHHQMQGSLTSGAYSSTGHNQPAQQTAFPQQTIASSRQPLLQRNSSLKTFLSDNSPFCRVPPQTALFRPGCNIPRLRLEKAMCQRENDDTSSVDSGEIARFLQNQVGAGGPSSSSSAGKNASSTAGGVPLLHEDGTARAVMNPFQLGCSSPANLHYDDGSGGEVINRGQLPPGAIGVGGTVNPGGGGDHLGKTGSLHLDASTGTTVLLPQNAWLHQGPSRSSSAGPPYEAPPAQRRSVSVKKASTIEDATPSLVMGASATSQLGSAALQRGGYSSTLNAAMLQETLMLTSPCDRARRKVQAAYEKMRSRRSAPINLVGGFVNPLDAGGSFPPSATLSIGSGPGLVSPAEPSPVASETDPAAAGGLPMRQKSAPSVGNELVRENFFLTEELARQHMDAETDILSLQDRVKRLRDECQREKRDRMRLEGKLSRQAKYVSEVSADNMKLEEELFNAHKDMLSGAYSNSYGTTSGAPSEIGVVYSGAASSTGDQAYSTAARDSFILESISRRSSRRSSSVGLVGRAQTRLERSAPPVGRHRGIPNPASIPGMMSQHAQHDRTISLPAHPSGSVSNMGVDMSAMMLNPMATSNVAAQSQAQQGLQHQAGLPPATGTLSAPFPGQRRTRYSRGLEATSSLSSTHNSTTMVPQGQYAASSSEAIDNYPPLSIAPQLSVAEHQLQRYLSEASTSSSSASTRFFAPPQRGLQQHLVGGTLIHPSAAKGVVQHQQPPAPGHPQHAVAFYADAGHLQGPQRNLRAREQAGSGNTSMVMSRGGNHLHQFHGSATAPQHSAAWMPERPVPNTVHEILDQYTRAARLVEGSGSGPGGVSLGTSKKPRGAGDGGASLVNKKSLQTRFRNAAAETRRMQQVAQNVADRGVTTGFARSKPFFAT